MYKHCDSEKTSRLQTILQGELPDNYIHPFTPLSASDTQEDIENRAAMLKAAGIHSMNLLWSDPAAGGMMALSQFNTDCYWEHMKWVCEACEKYDMTFMLQDAAPFPSGQADGWFDKPENSHLNKLYLAERHLDVKGPDEEGAFLVASLTGAMRVSANAEVLQGAIPVPDEKLIALVAMKRENDQYLADSAVDLTGMIDDGIAYWPVPEGIWRIFAIYETHNGGGRKSYMNLLDKESVALQIEAVHKPHYEHLKDALGKTWLGFFYDETEIGNMHGYIFDDKVGSPGNLAGESQDLPWSAQMPSLCETVMGNDYRKKLPLLWFEDDEKYHRIRYQYMDIISKLIQENYNGQVHAWCKERGILYIGHNLEDENSHCRLACGPVHYFRMQAHQDMAGIDLIGGQIMPEKDFTQAWYGYPEGDGEFYHYGLAKLASSAAHIMPNKKGRSFCEMLAVYGDIAGTKIRRFIIDHLLVNGINNMIPADAVAAGFDIGYTRQINDYMNRMCDLLNHTKPVIKTAVLYHGEAEWYQDDYQYFQSPAKVLAQNQISYDVVPADIFTDRTFYQTSTDHGLCVNGNCYEAFIIPETKAIPQAVADFVEQAGQNNFPVIFVNRKPSVVAETGEAYEATYGLCVKMQELAETVKEHIKPDCCTYQQIPMLRYNRVQDENGTYYFLHNEGQSANCKLTLTMQAPVYRIDMERLTVTEIPCESVGEAVTVELEFGKYEAVLLYSGPMDPKIGKREEIIGKTELSGPWDVVLNGQDQLTLEKLCNLNRKDLYPRFAGEAVYQQSVMWDTVPGKLDLGDVQEACTVFINDIPVGTAVAAPYIFDISCAAKVGENRIKVVVTANSAHKKTEGMFAMFGSMMANTYNTLPANGLLGPVMTVYTKSES